MGAVLLLLVNIISGSLSSSIADTKGWSRINWWLAGFFFGPLGLLAAAGLPDRRLRIYLRHLATDKGWKDDTHSLRDLPETGTDADSQRRRILGAQ